MVKNPSANAGDVGGQGLTPGLEDPLEEDGSSLQLFLWGQFSIFQTVSGQSSEDLVSACISLGNSLDHKNRKVMVALAFT